MTLLRLLPLLLLSVQVIAQQTSPNGRYYENLPHGRVAQDLDGTRAVYLPPGKDSIHSLAIVTDPSALLDSKGTVYLPWILDNLIAQGAIRPVAAVLLSEDTDERRQAILSEIRRMDIPVAEDVQWQPLPEAETTAALVTALRAAAEDVPWQVEAGVYSFPDAGVGSILFRGPTAHFKSLVMMRWSASAEVSSNWDSSPDSETIYIVREGSMKVEIGDSTWLLSPQSVLFLAAGDVAVFRPVNADSLVAYRMDYSANHPVRPGASFVVPYRELTFQPHDRGGLWNYFRRSTPTCPYYEMHKTQLNPGIKSHEPHVHRAAEIVIMIEGTTEMEIGDDRYSARAGDVYYLPSQVPHAIRNTGESACTYLAFQWDSEAVH
ncbi:cupin domain-containing protein [Lewinella sp. IMCC34191]|uniref:cupin domain-containing protein n=1 Tax=Lewinella sp. IMCC34191 TaxID=2259172 RepID=UPI000E283B5C|nr:cupin domain-containing protein [Lewinella sp. IMCC34191]